MSRAEGTSSHNCSGNQSRLSTFAPRPPSQGLAALRAPAHHGGSPKLPRGRPKARPGVGDRRRASHGAGGSVTAPMPDLRSRGQVAALGSPLVRGAISDSHRRDLNAGPGGPDKRGRESAWPLRVTVFQHGPWRQSLSGGEPQCPGKVGAQPDLAFGRADGPSATDAARPALRPHALDLLSTEKDCRRSPPLKSLSRLPGAGLYGSLPFLGETILFSGPLGDPPFWGPFFSFHKTAPT